MSLIGTREADGGDDPTVAHLREALRTAEDDAVRFHIRQALQHQYIADDVDA